MTTTHITIIGAGVVGLAIAAELSGTYSDIVVLEQHGSFGQETSSRNSEVVHSGIYYPEGSLKASLCIEGARLMYEFCATQSVPHRKIGKIIVAADPAEEKEIRTLYERGTRNGAKHLQIISAETVKNMEPAVNARMALHSADTGIIDSHTFMKRLYDIGRSKNVIFAFRNKVVDIRHLNKGFDIGIAGEREKLRTTVLINAAGLSSDQMADLAGIDTEEHHYKLQYCKGSYFSYTRRSPVQMLVYPVPQHDLKGLGVHATLDLAGKLRFGPDTELVETIDYVVDETKRDMFYASASRIISGLEKAYLAPDMAGIRPRLRGDGVKDFIIRDESDKGLPGLINCIGIESPGLTSALAIARHVAVMVKQTVE